MADLILVLSLGVKLNPSFFFKLIPYLIILENTSAIDKITTIFLLKKVVKNPINAKIVILPKSPDDPKYTILPKDNAKIKYKIQRLYIRDLNLSASLLLPVKLFIIYI